MAARSLSGTRTTPNAVTTASLIVGLIAAWSYVEGGVGAHIGAGAFVLAFWLDHVDGELARMTGRTSRFGHHYDLAAGGIVLVALFVGIGIGSTAGPLGQWAPGLGVAAGGATAIIFVLRGQLEERAGKGATQQPNLLGFEIEDLMYLVAPLTWLGGLDLFLVLSGIGTPLFALWVIRERRRCLAQPA